MSNKFKNKTKYQKNTIFIALLNSKNLPKKFSCHFKKKPIFTKPFRRNKTLLFLEIDNLIDT
ncbi:MAG TPA: hypothetical protein DER08_08465 [Flavobacterium sp.]|nr:MAG: hypothetical protein A2X21_08760 [Flavobacteria bacterium GWA2_35_26]HCF04365.1 hypothetical protein [Flavobacterium sp.]